MRKKGNKKISKSLIWAMVLLISSSPMSSSGSIAYATTGEIGNLPIVEQEMEQEKTIESISEIAVNTSVDEPPVLPSVVQAVYNDKTTTEVAVSWDQVDASSYAQVGVFGVEGSIAGTNVKATATITVVENPGNTLDVEKAETTADIDSFLDELKNNIPAGQVAVSYTNNYQSMEPEAMTFVKGKGTASVNNGLTVAISEVGSGAIATWDKAPWLSAGIIDTTLRYTSGTQGNVGFVLGSNDGQQGISIRYDNNTDWVIQSPDGTGKWEVFIGPKLLVDTDYHIQIGFNGKRLLVNVDGETYYNKDTDLLSQSSGIGQVGLYKRFATGSVMIKDLRIEGVGTKEKPSNVVDYIQDYEDPNYIPNWSGLNAQVVTDLTGNKVLSLKRGTGERGVDLDSPQIQEGTLSLDFKLVNPAKLGSGQGFAFGFRMNDTASIFNEIGVDPSQWIPESNTGWGSKLNIPYPIQGRWNNLMFNFKGKTITVYMNKKEIGDIPFDKFSDVAGRFGLRIRSTVELHIDNVQYTNQIVTPKQIVQYSNDFQDGITGNWSNGATSSIIREGNNKVLKLSNINENTLNMDAPLLPSATYMLSVKPETSNIGFVIGNDAQVKYDGAKWILKKGDNSIEFAASSSNDSSPKPLSWNKVGIQYSDSSVTLSINGTELRASLPVGQQFGEGRIGVMAQGFVYVDNILFTEEFIDMDTTSSTAGKMSYEEYYEGQSLTNWEGFNSAPQISDGYLQGTINAGKTVVNKDVTPVPNGIYQLKLQADETAGVKLGNIAIYQASPGHWKYQLDGSSNSIEIGNASVVESGKDYTLRVQIVENELSLYVNGILVGNASIDAYSPGDFGIYNSSNRAIQIKVDAITAEEIRIYEPDYTTQNWGPLDSSKPVVLSNGEDKIQLNMPGVAVAVDKDSPTFVDQKVSFDFKTNVSSGSDGGRYGFVVRGSAADSYVSIVHDINGNWKLTANGNEVFFPNTYEMKADTFYRINLQLVGKIVGFTITDVNGVTTDMGSVSEEEMTLQPGWFGLRSWYGSKEMMVSDLKIVELESLPRLQIASEVDVINKDGLGVTVYKDFPGIVEYQVGDHKLQANVEQTNSIKINNIDYVPQTISTKEGDNKYLYTMTIDEIGVIIEAHIEVKENNVVRFAIDKITEKPDGVVVRSVQLNNSLIHVNSSMDDATYAWNKSDGAWHGLTEDIVDNMSLMKQSGTIGVTMAMVSANGLGASVENNVYSGGNKLIVDTEKKPLVNKVTVKPGTWTYRHLQSDEIEELPWYEIVVTEDRNNDGKADWQDAAVAYRTFIFDEPFGANDIKNNMMYIAFNFASQANDPFLNTLDTGKVLYNYTDGFGQMILHKGYQAEGHDDDIPSYSNIGVRQGGLKDFNYLIDEGDKYNLNIGVHLNATEYQLDANELNYSDLNGAATNRLSKGWDWIDTAYYVDQTKDVLSGNLKKRFENLYNLTKDPTNPNDPALDFYYIDVYTGNDYNARKLLQYANDLGVKIGTEFAGPLEPGSTFVHWGPDLGYPNKGNKSILSRMVKNNLDIFVGNALFKGQKIPVVATWGDSKPDMQQGVTVFFNEVLPTKFMQHFGVLKYEEDQITFENDVVSRRNKTTGMIELSKNGKLISSWADTGTTTDEAVRHTGEANSLIPWVWDIKNDTVMGLNDGAKLYHWNTTGNPTTWELTDEFKDVREFNMYELTQQGKVLVDKLVAENGSLTINQAKKNTPYVLYPASANAETIVPAASNWGEGSLIKDFAFNSEKFNAPGSWKADDSNNIAIKVVPGDVEYDTTKEMTNSNWNRFAEVGSKAGVLSQEITGLQPGQDYTVGVWTSTEPGRKSSLQVTVDGKTYTSVVTGKDGIHQSSFKYVGTKWQRMNVEFKVPAGVTTATVKLVAEAGTGTVQYDDVRIWEHITVEKDPTNKGYVVYEDFENVYEGWGPFEYGGGSRQIHIASDRSNSNDNNPIVSTSENKIGPVMTWVLHGENSLKLNETDVNKLIKTNESSVKLEPNTAYDLGFIYTLEASANYEVSVQSRSTGAVVLKETLNKHANPGNKTGVNGGYIRFQQNFTTGNHDDYQVIFKLVSKGAGGATSDYALILDDFYIKADDVNISKELLQQSIADVHEMISSDYTSESWAHVVTALDEAEKLLVDPKATVTLLDQARLKLKNAIEGLILKVTIVAIENVAVETEVGTAPKLPVEVTVTLSNHATQKATVVWEVIDPSSYAKVGTFQVKGSVDGSDIKAIATVNVKAAINISKELLQQSIADARELNSSDYTSESWAKVATALDEAEKLLVDPKATVTLLDQARLKLENAIKGLVSVATIVAIENVTVGTKVGTAPKLPAEVTVTLSNHVTQKELVVWEAIAPSSYAKVGTFQVKGSVDGTDIKATATVNVKAKDSGNPGTGTNPDTGTNPETNPNPDPGTDNGTVTNPDPETGTPKQFEDTVNHWANEEISALASKGIIMGKTDQKFAPNMTINRSEIAAMLTRAFGLEASGSTSFKDVVEDKWYSDSVIAATEAGLFKGYEGNLFGPTNLLTRQEMAVIIVRALEMKGKLPVGSDNIDKTLAKYKDADQAAVWSKQAFAISIELGLIQGTPDMKLNPKENLTRAEAAVLLSRLLKYLS
ncbi:endo-alpha-N-acetylgalactosaminidase family protein [Paenibacillus endoradicis]|uniref:endo-alpha-N-acetylgalactosaminidase family protein n=1 Tax=Paenibacillus endoradicis TaxID=2972487 RepID=UPI002159B494|nr:endo-alpha-N-acetylgalactosaminidase family protein [Paenibacillus endoradicis]MCR8657026.1 endo-alpha-N-acetylgalactosaminidase family protein [Paenibacillus endoradicis]